MLWMAGPRRQFEWFNIAWELFSGRSVDELRREGWLGLVHPEDVERCTGIYEASSEARHPYVLDYRMRRHDGHYRWVLESGDAAVRRAGHLRRLHRQRPRHPRAQAVRGAAGRTHPGAAARGAAPGYRSSRCSRTSCAIRWRPIANAASVLRSLEEGSPVLVRLREILERQVGRLSRLVEELIEVTRAAQGNISLVVESLPVETLVQRAVTPQRRGGHARRPHPRRAPARQPAFTCVAMRPGWPRPWPTSSPMPPSSPPSRG